MLYQRDLLEFLANVIAVVKVCKKYYMIDVVVDGITIRPRKYTKEYTNITSTWYDYLGNEITDNAEIARIEAEATADREVEENYDDYMMFMESGVAHDNLLIPTTNHFVKLDWTPAGGVETIKMNCLRGIEGDSYLIYVKNVGASPAVLYLPVLKEEETDPTAGEGYENIPVHAEYLNLQPGSVGAVRSTFREGAWYYEVIAKPEASQQGVVSISSADYLVFRYLWEADAGQDLDTATELLNSGIPGVDNNAVGWSCPGNSNSTVTSILKWAGDNRQSGAECVWLSIKELRDKYVDTIPNVTEFMTYATWYASKGTGKASFNLIAYKGGEMSQEGFNFINTGGEEVYNKIHSFEVNTVKGMPDYKGSYTPVTKITYDKAKNQVSMAVGDIVIDNQNSMEELYNLFSNYLAKDNQTPYVPAEDYNPATKKYVDDSVSPKAFQEYVDDKLALKADKKAVEDALDLKLDANLVGVAGGVAQLDDTGKVPSGMLPSYVDDVIDLKGFVQAKTDLPTTNIVAGDMYYVIDDTKIYTYDGTSYDAGQTPEGSKIYQTLNNNKIWRWSGTAMVTTGSDLALGETAQTAYAGDKGKKNADNIAALTTKVNAIETQIGDIGTILDNINGEVI